MDLQDQRLNFARGLEGPDAPLLFGFGILHPKLWMLMVPKEAGVLLLSNADGLTDVTRQQVLAVVDQTTWGV